MRAARAKFARSQVDLDTRGVQTRRVVALERKSLVPIATADDARGKLAEAEAKPDKGIHRKRERMHSSQPQKKHL